LTPRSSCGATPTGPCWSAAWSRRRNFRAATAITNAAGIFHLARPLNFAGMPEVAGRLERHWLDIGLTEKAA
jgi:hypothetical protein